MFTLAGQAAVGNEREEFISTRKHLVSFDSLHRNSGGNSNKQTGQARRGGENVKQRLNIISAAGEICSLLAKSLIVFFPFFFQPHLFQHQFHLSSRRLVHTTCFLLHISSAGSRVRGSSETCLGLCSINRAGRGGAVIIQRLKNLLF